MVITTLFSLTSGLLTGCGGGGIDPSPSILFLQYQSITFDSFLKVLGVYFNDLQKNGKLQKSKYL